MPSGGHQTMSFTVGVPGNRVPHLIAFGMAQMSGTFRHGCNSMVVGFAQGMMMFALELRAPKGGIRQWWLVRVAA